MNLDAVYILWLREIKRFLRSKSRIIGSLAFPSLILIIIGTGLNSVFTMGTLSYSEFLAPGMIGMVLLFSSISFGIMIIWDRQFGFLKEILVAPLARTGIVLGKAAGTAAIATAQGIVLLILAPLLGVKVTLLMVVELIPILIIISVSLSALGVLIASRMRSQQGFQIIVQIIIFPLIFLSGVFFPVNNVPDWMEFIVKINPLTYGVDAIRQLFLGATGANAIGVTVLGHTMTIIEDMLVVVVLGVILMVAAAWSFGRQE